MQSTAHDFNANVDTALADPNLQDSLAMLKVGFSERRRLAAERLPEFEALRDRLHLLALFERVGEQAYRDRLSACRSVLDRAGQLHASGRLLLLGDGRCRQARQRQRGVRRVQHIR